MVTDRDDERKAVLGDIGVVQAREFGPFRIGQRVQPGAGLFGGRKETLMFNGYGDQVASLYAGMDLSVNY